jgi:predicted lipoprotein with Yx(FWY)xxD motif
VIDASNKTYALALLAVLGALALLVAGCGGGDSSTGESSNASAKEDASSESSSGYGSRYGGNGESETKSASDESLYDFHKDKGRTSSCYGACAKVWPPLLSEGAPQVGNGASAAKLGTSERKDGTTQVTYAGHPLYTYVADQKPGEANGNDIDDFGAEWYALQGNGEEPED